AEEDILRPGLDWQDLDHCRGNAAVRRRHAGRCLVGTGLSLKGLCCSRFFSGPNDFVRLFSCQLGEMVEADSKLSKTLAQRAKIPIQPLQACLGQERFHALPTIPIRMRQQAENLSSSAGKYRHGS